jgi:hypothetical protein
MVIQLYIFRDQDHEDFGHYRVSIAQADARFNGDAKSLHGFPHGMPTQTEMLNAALPAFIRADQN